jgi:hypothetical protein
VEAQEQPAQRPSLIYVLVRHLRLRQRLQRRDGSAHLSNTVGTYRAISIELSGSDCIEQGSKQSSGLRSIVLDSHREQCRPPARQDLAHPDRRPARLRKRSGQRWLDINQLGTALNSVIASAGLGVT